jgi:hypothetical protein
MKVVRQILQSARLTELRTSVMETAALCEQRASVRLPTSSVASRRCLLQLLVLERKRNAKLTSVVENG